MNRKKYLKKRDNNINDDDECNFLRKIFLFCNNWTITPIMQIPVLTFLKILTNIKLGWKHENKIYFERAVFHFSAVSNVDKLLQRPSLQCVGFSIFEHREAWKFCQWQHLLEVRETEPDKYFYLMLMWLTRLTW